MIKLFLKKVKSYIFQHNFIKKYRKIALKLKENIENKNLNENIKSDKIFVCWFQGIENMPEIVKICYKSLVKFHPTKEIIVITENNFSEYVDFPQFILDKYKLGLITKTHFSDLLRLELLIKYGGTWVDSTMFFTEEIPKYILDSKLFLFQEFIEHNGGTKGISSWFISSCANNKLLLLERDLLYVYWTKNKILKNYYLFHIFFNKIVIKLYDKEWGNVILSDNLSPKILDCYLFKQFDKRLFDIIIKNNFAHKLMYKYSKKEFDKPNTFYKYLKDITDRG